MLVGNAKKIVFVLPFVEMVSNYVRALCLQGYETEKWQFVYLKGTYPVLFRIFILRTVYRYSYYIYELWKLKSQSGLVVAYFIKPSSPFLLLLVRRLLGIRVMVDINDPYHLPQLLGFNATSNLFENADRLIFESEEYANYWHLNYSRITEIVPDTPQHECVYLNSASRDKSVLWVGSPHTANYLRDYLKYFELFAAYGYQIRFLGISSETLSILHDAYFMFTFVENYNVDMLAEELSKALVSFIPMPEDNLFELRGNLKAKVSMGYGCLTIASGLPMHKRLITNKVNGYLFDGIDDFQEILVEIENRSIASSISLEGNKYVSNKYTRNRHASALIEIAEKISLGYV